MTTCLSILTCEFLVPDYLVPHRPVTPLPLLPHPKLHRVPTVYKIKNPNIRFGCVLAVQPARVLLQPGATIEGSFERSVAYQAASS